jgi:hypothetical protein
MTFDPHSITQDELHRLRAAAEDAWGDDTRQDKFQGHPQPSHGQCYVTSQWLTTRLGGHVGVKDGHYFWVSSDKEYVIDLTGDQFAQSPKDLQYENSKLDAEDEGWHPHPDHLKWNPGPILYKRANHSLYSGFRIKDTPANARAKKFALRADSAYDA